MKKIILSLVFGLSILCIFAQQPMKTETLPWCKCDPATNAGIETRKASECEIIFYDTIVTNIFTALKKALQDNGVPNFAVSSVFPDESFHIEIVAGDFSDHPYSFYGIHQADPLVVWDNINPDTNEVNFRKMDSLSKILENSFSQGDWSPALNDNITYQIMKIQQSNSVRLTIFINRDFEQIVYGSRKPYIFNIAGTSQAYSIPFSQNLSADNSSGYKGITDNEIILLYGLYKPVSVVKTPEDSSYTINILTDVAPSQPKLNLYCVELRFQGNQQVIEAIIKLIDHQKINDIIRKY